MWIVQLALRRPYTFIVLALLVLIVGPLTILRTPVDIFPNINIPVVSVIWRYTGLSSEEMEGRMIAPFERAMSATVNDIEHIESQSVNGVGVVKVFFHPTANIQTGLAQIVAISQTMLASFPPGTTPPLILQYTASTVPILQLALSSSTIAEHELNDTANSFMRTQLATVQGAVLPYPYGGKMRQVMVDIDPKALQAKNLGPQDVVDALSLQNLILPSGTVKIGDLEYDVALNGSPKSVQELNDLPVRTTPRGGTIYIRDVAHVRDGFQPQTNIVRHDGERAVLLTILKYGNASTLDIVNRVKAELPRIQAALPPAIEIQTALDQSLFVRAAVDGVIFEAILAACLTALMILLFLGSWRSTLIIAVSIPLSILTSIIIMSALGQTINIMTLGGLALAVGILVDDATVAIENINQHLEQGKGLEQSILDGAQQIAIPTFVSTLCICIVFVPMFLLTGVARYLFVPMARRSCSPCSRPTSSRARWCRPWRSTCCGVTSTMRRVAGTCLAACTQRSRPVSRACGRAIATSWSGAWVRLSCSWAPCSRASSCRVRCSRSSAATSSRPWMQASSSCICAPEPAPAWRRPRASATWSRRGSARCSPPRSWKPFWTTSACP